MGKEDIFERIEKKTNVNKDTIIKLAKELENGNFKDENTLIKMKENAIKLAKKKSTQEICDTLLK